MKRKQYKAKDSREIAYYIENGVYPFDLTGYKCLLSAYFYEDEIFDLRENWYLACEEYKKQRQEYNKNNIVK